MQLSAATRFEKVALGSHAASFTPAGQGYDYANFRSVDYGEQAFNADLPKGAVRAAPGNNAGGGLCSSK